MRANRWRAPSLSPVPRCPACEHDNADETEFCASCGASLANGEQTLAHEVVAAAPTLTPSQRALVADVPAGIGVLAVERGPNAGSRFLLDAERTTIGRHPDSDIFLDDITVSRRHASVSRDGDAYRLADVGSLNGTYLNDTRVDDMTLRAGDALQIGRYRLVFLVGVEG